MISVNYCRPDPARPPYVQGRRQRRKGGGAASGQVSSFYIPYPMDFFLLEITFGSWIYFLRFLKSIDCYGFSYGFLVVLNLFH
jgi:hypothetical protein